MAVLKSKKQGAGDMPKGRAAALKSMHGKFKSPAQSI
jgi:hypothetical protein